MPHESTRGRRCSMDTVCISITAQLTFEMLILTGLFVLLLAYAITTCPRLRNYRP